MDFGTERGLLCDVIEFGDGGELQCILCAGGGG